MAQVSDVKIDFSVDNDAVIPLIERLQGALSKLDKHVANLVSTRIEELHQANDLIFHITDFHKSEMHIQVFSYPTESFLHMAQAVFSKRYEDLLPSTLTEFVTANENHKASK